MKWYPGDSFHRHYDEERTFYTFYWSPSPIRPKTKADEPWYKLSATARDRARKISKMMIDLVVYVPRGVKRNEGQVEVGIFFFDGRKDPTLRIVELKGRSDQEIIPLIQDRVLEEFLSPMELLSLGLSKTNPADLKGRYVPARYLKGLPKKLKAQRLKELTRSRDAYKHGDYSELPTDVLARKHGLVKQSAYSIVAEERGIEWQGDARDMAKRTLKYYGIRSSRPVLEKMTEGIQRSYNKGLAAWKSGGHRPGATATNWAVARVASLVVGGKAAFTADKKEFSWFPEKLQNAILAEQSDVIEALKKQKRTADVRFLESI